MRLEILLSNFRGFHSQSWIPVRPITLLVGENSAGKTSLLAAVAFVSEFLKGGVEASFNSEPFQLGTFEQIAHNRGGRAGRAKEFTIGIRKNVELSEQIGHGSQRIELRLNFGAIESNAAVTGLEFRGRRESLTIKSQPDSETWEYIGPNREKINLSDVARYAPAIRTVGLRYFTFIARDLFLRERKGGDVTRSSEDGQSSFDTFFEYVEQFLREISTLVHATSAIRTRPHRTYTPGLDNEDSEGSHVPYQIAKLFRKRNKDDWEGLKSALVQFGRESEMFHDIEVKSFGSSASDPFQIQFSNHGPKRNLVDLGYGTSQVLPILYHSARYSDGICFLIQQPEVHLHPRAQAALGGFFVNAHLKKGQDFILETHSDFLVDRVRMSIRSEMLHPEDVSLLFFERHRLENKIHQVRLGEDGEPINPPLSYREFFIDEELRQLGVDGDAASN